MKWAKRLLLFVLFLGMLAAVVFGAGWWMSRRAPAWYSRRHATEQERRAAAVRAQRELMRSVSWAQDQQASADRAATDRAHDVARPPASRPSQTLEISLSEDELNGFFQTWDEEFHWTAQTRGLLADPQIVIRDGQLILAATAKELGTVVSIVFEPRLDHGKLEMPVAQVLAGRLPVPQSWWNRYRAPLASKLEDELPGWRAGADIRPNGSANPDAVAAAMGDLLLDVLENRPARPVLFLPYDLSHEHRSLPVKVTHVDLSDRTLTLTVEPLSPDGRRALLTSLRAPHDSQVADAPTPPAGPAEQ